MSKKKRALKRLKQFESFASAPVSKKKTKLPIATAEQVVDRFIKILKSKKEPLDNKLKKIMSNIESAPKPDVKPDVKPGIKPGRVSPIPRKEPSVKPRPKAFAPKETPVKPDVKPGTKPGRVSPIPRKEPSVKPRPKAMKESIETSTNLKKQIASYVDDHGTISGRAMSIEEFANAVSEFFQCDEESVLMTLENLPRVDNPVMTGETLYLTKTNNDRTMLVLDQKMEKKILFKNYQTY